MRRDEVTVEAAGLREAVAAQARRAKTTPVAPAVRTRIVAFAARAQAAGWSLPQIARAVGVSVGSVRNWRAAPAPPALVPVVVQERPVTPAAALRVVAPSGYTVHGLDVATTAALLRALE